MVPATNAKSTLPQTKIIPSHDLWTKQYLRLNVNGTVCKVYKVFTKKAFSQEVRLLAWS